MDRGYIYRLYIVILYCKVKRIYVDVSYQKKYETWNVI
jgi:hypothetical protein